MSYQGKEKKVAENFYEISRRQTRPVMVGKVQIGGGAPITIQSMTNTFTHEVQETMDQIKRLEDAGCELIRITVPDQKSLKALSKIKSKMTTPLIADIHFSYTLALAAIDEGADKIRINPGNIGGMDRLAQVVEKCKKHNVAMRVGVNAGSLEKDLLDKYNHPTPEAIVESALRHIHFIESLKFYNMIISVKSSHVPTMIQSYRLLAQKCDYPFHVGVTEAGTKMQGTVKSAAGIGAVLADGIGDTIRVSLTSDPVEEVKVATYLLRSLGFRKDGIDIVACPTCGRCHVDLEKMVDQVETATLHLKNPMRVAIMGCVVNGLGESAEADIGICAEKGHGILFERGEVKSRLSEEELVPQLLMTINQKIDNREQKK
jgi:(E)-4-hydroxy-3-methylbut-2-enyl-diphosphate synthase